MKSLIDCIIKAQRDQSFSQKAFCNWKLTTLENDFFVKKYYRL